MEIDWKRKAAINILNDLPDDVDDARQILEYTVQFLERVALHQIMGGCTPLPEGYGPQAGVVVAFARPSNM